MAYTDKQFAQLLQIIANSKLFSELSEQTVISDDGFFASINTGNEDAKKIKLPLLRGYSGDWNATTNTPSLANGAGVSGTVYRVGVAGSRDLGNGALTYGVDEIIYYNGAKWVKLIQSQISDIVGLQEALDALQTGLYLQGNWNAATNTPDIETIAETGYYWIVNVPGSTNIGGKTDWKVPDWVIKTANGWAYIDNTDKITEIIAGSGLTGGGDEGALTLNAIGGDGITVNANDIQVDSTVVRTTGNQTIEGSKVFTLAVATPTIYSPSSNLNIVGGGAQINFARCQIQLQNSQGVIISSPTGQTLDLRSGGANTLMLNSDQSATFASDVDVNGNITATGNVSAVGGLFSGNITATGNVSAVGGLFSGNVTAQNLNSTQDIFKAVSFAMDFSDRVIADGGTLESRDCIMDNYLKITI